MMTMKMMPGVLLGLMLAACGTGDEAEPPASAQTCQDEPGISYVCGPRNAEDILRLGGSDWLLVTGMNGELTGGGLNGRLHLVNHRTREWREIFPGPAPRTAHNLQMFGGCPGPIDSTDFSAHGIALLQMVEDVYYVYMTSHGAREAIEVFELDVSGEPAIAWVGCVPMPATSWTNSVAVLDDGGFYATQFMDPSGSGLDGVRRGEITGHVFEWHPGQEVRVVPGTELSGPNGIAVSLDQRWLYVAAFGSFEVVRFDMASVPPEKESVFVGITPDNIRWAGRNLITAGGNVRADCSPPGCGSGGWSVVEITPFNMSANRIAGADASAALQGASSALIVDDEIWVGTFNGDRLAILPRP